MSLVSYEKQCQALMNRTTQTWQETVAPTSFTGIENYLLASLENTKERFQYLHLCVGVDADG